MKLNNEHIYHTNARTWLEENLAELSVKRRKLSLLPLTGVGSMGGGARGACAPHFFDGGGNCMFVPPPLNPTFSFST